MTAGVRTTDLPSAQIVDSLVANRDGTTVRIDVDRLVALVAAIMGPTYQTRALLFADLAWPAGAIGYVRGDSTPAFNGVYKKAGASGAGNWSRIGDLPSGAVEAGQLADIEAAVAAVEGVIATLGAMAFRPNVATADLQNFVIETNKINANAVTNGKLATVGAGTIKGRAAGAGIGDPQDLTPAQARTVLELGTAAQSNTGDFAAASHMHTMSQITDLAAWQSGILAGIAAEEAARIAGDAALNTEIDTERDVRETEVALLSEGINAEVLAREAADAVLQAQIDAGATGLTPRGTWSAAAGTFPTGSARGDFWIVSTGGTVGGVTWGAGDWLIALVANASPSVYAGNWAQADYSTFDTLTFATRATAAAATISGTVNLIVVERHSTGAPVSPAPYARAASASTGSFQSADGAHWAPAWGVTRPQMLGAVGDGAADDSTAIATAISLGREIKVDADRTHLISTYSNTLGVRVDGPGAIATAVTGGLLRHNIPFEGPVQFRHFLHAVKGQIIASTLLKVVVFGDSTATNGYGINIDGLIADELRNMGIGVAEVTLASVAGHAWGTQNLATILNGYADQKHLAICKFGINDAGASTTPIPQAVATLRNAMRQRLQEIRASAYGAASALSILLIMPNALANNATNANNRNNLWLEAIRGVYFEAARDFECALYDPYLESRWGQGQEDKSLDSFLLHPQPNYNLDIWGRALRETLEPFGSVARNRFVVRGATEGFAPVAATGLTGFTRGVSWLRAQSADGYPFGGWLVTERHPDTVGRQTLIDFTNDYPRQLTRHWRTAANAWSVWSGVGGLTALTLQNGWQNFGGNFGAPAVERTPDGQVRLHGAIRNGTTTLETLLFTLPAGFRPPAEVLVNCATLASPFVGQLRITAAGAVTLRIAGDATGMFLDGVGFWAVA